MLLKLALVSTSSNIKEKIDSALAQCPASVFGTWVLIVGIEASEM